MAIFIPKWEKFRDKKPYNPQEFDLNHELTRGLVFGVGVGGADIVGFNPETPTPDMHRDSSDNLVFNSANSLSPIGNTYGTKDASVSGVDGATATIIFKPKTNSTAFTGLFGATVALTEVGRWAVYYGSSGYSCFTNDSNNSVRGITPNIFPQPVTTSISYCIKHIGSDTLYIDRANVGSTASYVMSGDASRPIRIGAYADNNATYYGRFLGDIYLALKHNRTLNADEVDALHENPYQILKSRRKWFVFGTNIAVTTVALADSTSQSLADSITLTQTHELVADSSLSTSFADSLLLTQTQDLTLESSLSQAFADALVVQVANAITVALSDSTSTAQSDSLSVSQTQLVQLSSSLSTSEISSLQATQTHLIAFADAISSGFADTVTVSQGAVTTVTLSDSTSQSNIDNLVLTQSQIITLDGVESSAVIGNLNLTQTQEIVLSSSQSQAFADALQILGVGLGEILNPSVNSITLAKSVNSITPKLSIKHLN